MKVNELIELLKQMPQDVNVALGLDQAGQTSDNLTVSLEKAGDTNYVFIGDY
jgi:hypothetical protein